MQQPAWSVPTRKVEEPVLRVYNSLTKSKVRTYGRGVLALQLSDVYNRQSSFRRLAAT